MHPVQIDPYGKIVKNSCCKIGFFDGFGDSFEKIHKNPMHFLLKITQNRVIISYCNLPLHGFVTHFDQKGHPYPLHGLLGPE